MMIRLCWMQFILHPVMLNTVTCLCCRRPEAEGRERRRGGHQGREVGQVPGHEQQRTPLRIGEVQTHVSKSKHSTDLATLRK